LERQETCHCHFKFHKVKQVRVIRRKRKQDIQQGKKKTEAVNVPVAISDYNQKARGVDVFDQYSNYQMLSHRSTRWYFRIIIFLIETACVNSWVLYQNQCLPLALQKVLDYPQYRRALGKVFAHQGAVKKVTETPIKNSGKNMSEVTELWGQCHLGKIEKKKLCYRCKGHQTRHICDECDLPLCLIPCYDLHRLHEKTHKVFFMEKGR